MTEESLTEFEVEEEGRGRRVWAPVQAPVKYVKQAVEDAADKEGYELSNWSYQENYTGGLRSFTGGKPCFFQTKLKKVDAGLEALMQPQGAIRIYRADYPGDLNYQPAHGLEFNRGLFAASNNQDQEMEAFLDSVIASLGNYEPEINEARRG